MTHMKGHTLDYKNAEGYLYYSGDEGVKRPLIVLVHGGPFGGSPKNMFL
jgi:dipeptidyl aminopeptidase/acylaminoacyl peptidase